MIAQELGVCPRATGNGGRWLSARSGAYNRTAPLANMDTTGKEDTVAP